MTAVATERELVRIALEADCAGGDLCEMLAARTHAQLSTGRYTWPCSTMPLPGSIGEWEQQHRTARKRAWRAQRLGYGVSPVDRHLYEQDVFEINVSMPERQGRPMSDSYQLPVRYDPHEQLTHGCARHGIHTYGALTNGTLVAYAWVYRVGQLVMLSQILGHADHLANDVMYLLVRGVLEHEISNGDGVVFYNMHSSGTDGLRYFKERVGLAASEVRWSVT